MSDIVHKEIWIKMLLNPKTGLLAAFSDDLKGLLVVGKTTGEIVDKLPDAITEILEATGNKVIDITVDREVEDDWTPTPRFRAEANLDRAA